MDIYYSIDFFIYNVNKHTLNHPLTTLHTVILSHRKVKFDSILGMLFAFNSLYFIPIGTCQGTLKIFFFWAECSKCTATGNQLYLSSSRISSSHFFWIFTDKKSVKKVTNNSYFKLNFNLFHSLVYVSSLSAVIVTPRHPLHNTVPIFHISTAETNT